MRKKLLVIICTLLVAAVSTGTVNRLWATSIDDEKKKQQEMEDELKDSQSMLAQLQTLKSDTTAYIAALDEKLNTINANIDSLNAQAADTQTQIDATNATLAAQEIDIADQYDSMKKRIRFIYENGDSQYLDLVLNSADLSDFLNKAEYISKITEYDRKMLQKMKDTKDAIEQSKATLESQQTQLAKLTAESQAEQQSVQVLMDDKKNQLLATDNQINQAASDIDDQQAEIEAQKELVAELQQIETRRKEEEEKARKKAQEEEELRKNAAANTSNGSTSSSGTSSNSSASIPSYDGGMFQWPLTGIYTITSPYGTRVDPINGNTAYHNGLDIGAPTGTPIHAVYDGTVEWANYSTTAGNWIGIYHGNGLYSIYMHASKLNVSAGDKISKGDVIALVGSTGRSTGPHLHISVRLNGSYVDPNNYFN